MSREWKNGRGGVQYFEKTLKVNKDTLLPFWISFFYYYSKCTEFLCTGKFHDFVASKYTDSTRLQELVRRMRKVKFPNY